MVKHFKNLLSRYNWADFDGTLYEASETKALYILYKLLPWFDLDLFYGMVKVCNLGFYEACSETIETIAILSKRLNSI